MKIRTLLLTLVLGASTCVVTAQDNDQRPEGQRRPNRGGPGGPGGPEGRGGQRGGPGGERFIPPIVAALDLNKNGTIDEDEIAQAKKSLKKLDLNKDGKITPEEYRPQRPGGPRGRGVRGPDGDRRGPGGPRPEGDRPRRPRPDADQN